MAIDMGFVYFSCKRYSNCYYFSTIDCIINRWKSINNI